MDNRQLIIDNYFSIEFLTNSRISFEAYTVYFYCKLSISNYQLKSSPAQTRTGDPYIISVVL